MDGKRDNQSAPNVVIVGAGFGGLVAARTLARSPVRVTLIDRKNHHTFQPLLYQVATAGLSPGEIAAPIRWIVRGRNVEVLLGEVQDFDLDRRMVKLSDVANPLRLSGRGRRRQPRLFRPRRMGAPGAWSQDH